MEGLSNCRRSPTQRLLSPGLGARERRPVLRTESEWRVTLTPPVRVWLRNLRGALAAGAPQQGGFHMEMPKSMASWGPSVLECHCPRHQDALLGTKPGVGEQLPSRGLQVKPLRRSHARPWPGAHSSGSGLPGAPLQQGEPWAPDNSSLSAPDPSGDLACGGKPLGWGWTGRRGS